MTHAAPIALHHHLDTLGCPRVDRPDMGVAHWHQEVDLFGARHDIQVLWSPEGVRAEGTLTDAAGVHPVWAFEANTSPSGRLRLTHQSGALLEEPTSLAEVIACAAQAIQALGGASVGRLIPWAIDPEAPVSAPVSEQIASVDAAHPPIPGASPPRMRC